MISQIKSSEQKSRDVQAALERADLRKQVALSKNNQRMAVRLFS